MSLAGQVEYIREQWRDILPPELMVELLTALDIVREERRRVIPGGSGPSPGNKEFRKGGSGYQYPKCTNAYSADSDWMANVVMIAKMVYVWLGQLAKKYGRRSTASIRYPMRNWTGSPAGGLRRSG